jgi:hypothetical protein
MALHKQIKDGYSNAFYRTSVIYVITLLTIIFAFQMYRYFYAAPASKLTCPTSHVSTASTILQAVFSSG